jgi:hypothetical protein
LKRYEKNVFSLLFTSLRMDLKTRLETVLTVYVDYILIMLYLTPRLCSVPHFKLHDHPPPHGTFPATPTVHPYLYPTTTRSLWHSATGSTNNIYTCPPPPTLPHSPAKNSGWSLIPSQRTYHNILTLLHSPKMFPHVYTLYPELVMPSCNTLHVDTTSPLTGKPTIHQCVPSPNLKGPSNKTLTLLPLIDWFNYDTPILYVCSD